MTLVLHDLGTVRDVGQVSVYCMAHHHGYHIGRQPLLHCRLVGISPAKTSLPTQCPVLPDQSTLRHDRGGSTSP